MNPQRPRPVAGGFSLLELLLTLAIILILSALLYGPSSRTAQNRIKGACRKNLQTIFVALEIYAGEFQEKFPERAGAPSSEDPLSLLIPKYTSITEPFICPGSKDERLPEAEPFGQRRISYAYYMGRRMTKPAEALMTDRQVNTDPKPPGAYVFSNDGQGPGGNHHKYGGNVMFTDGRVEAVPARVPFALPLPAGVMLLNPKP